MDACHIALGAVCLGTYLGVGTFHSTRQISCLGAYPGVDAYLGYYGIYCMFILYVVLGPFQL